MKQTKRTIVIFGGLMKKKSNGTWKTEDFNYLRVLAGYYLYQDMKKGKNVKLIVSGGRGIYDKIPNVPAVATVMKKELIQLGLSAKEILEKNKTASTYQELVWLTKLLNKNTGKIIVISNNYHLPRIKVMVSVIPELKKLKKNLTLASAEKISMKYNKNLKNKIEKMARSSKMIKTVLLEKEGIKALKSGQYKFR
ncbi:MAG: YdcF family protein [Patescibacteria group bacterium]